jgi:hypothetical protein
LHRSARSRGRAEHRRDKPNAELEQEIARYARAVAEVGPRTSLLAELRQRETRRDHLKDQLLAVTGATSVVAAFDPVVARRNLRARLAEWQALLRRQTAQARGIRREILVGRLVFAPNIDGAARYYEFSGRATLSGLFAGSVTSDMLVTPAGLARSWSVQIRGVARAA